MSSLIDLTQDSGSEDEDLKLAIAMSLSQSHNGNGGAPPKSSLHNASSQQPQAAASGIAGLDRKQMEAERLARLKRKRGNEAISPPPLSRRTKTRSPLSQSLSKVAPESAPSIELPTSKIPPPKLPKSTLQYPNGTIKRTWVSSHARTDRDITFSELIDAPNLKSALLSSYIWDFDWLFPHFRTNETNFVLVMHAHNPQHETLLRQDFASIPNIRLVFPSTAGIINCMHSKLQLLFYASHCRIVIPTANLMAFDWGEGGVMENSVFIIDLPRLDSTVEATQQRQQQQEKHPFYDSLMQFLQAQDIPDDVLRRLSRFDFAATAQRNIAFVHTIGGAHTDEGTWRRTGHCGLGRTVRQMGLAPRTAEGESIEIDFVTSSVGSLNEEFMRGMFLAAAGDDGMSELGIRQGKGEAPTSTTKASSNGGIKTFFPGHERKHSTDGSADEEEPPSGKAQLAAVPGRRNAAPCTSVLTLPNPSTWRASFRLFFPSAHTIASSLGGPSSAGTICFQRRWWENAKFPRANMRDCISVRRGVLMHNKIMFVRFKRAEEERKRGKKGERREHAGWVYLGSANLSESAWGRLVVDRARMKMQTQTKKKEDKRGSGSGNGNGNVKLNCRNWECGVVMPVPVREGKEGLDVFDNVLPVPMVYPGTNYEDDSDLEPWFFGKEGMADNSRISEFSRRDSGLKPVG